MKKNNLRKERKRNIWEDRAVMTGVVAASVFLCLFTIIKFMALKIGRQLPFDGQEVQCQSTENGTEQLAEESESTGRTETDIDMERPEFVTEQLETVTEETGVLVTEQEEEFPYLLKINRQQNVVTAYEKDENGEYTVPVRAILCSAGVNNATPRGIFHLSSKYTWRQLHGGVYGQYASRITGGILFHSVPYARKNKSTLYWEKYNKLGQHASMGCVRLTVEDAKWIYDNCPSGTTVEVYDSEEPGPLGKPETLKLDRDNANRGWDPTDPDEKNPWHEWSKDA